MARWAMIMSEYNYMVEYVPGVINTAADALSRLINIPESRWQRLTMPEDDSDESHPFLLLWPELQLLVGQFDSPAVRQMHISDDDIDTHVSDLADRVLAILSLAGFTA